MKKINLNSLVYMYYPIVFFIYLGSMFLPNIIMPGVLMSILILILFCLTNKFNIKISNGMVLSYFIYNIIMALIPILKGMQFDIGIREFSNSALPILFFFIGNQKFFNMNKFLKSFIIFIVLLFGIGLILHYVFPPIYIDYLSRTIYNFYLESYLVNKRFNSLTGSISIGFFAALTMLVSYYFYTKTKNKRYLVLYFTSIVISILSYQRASYLLIAIIFILSQLHFVVKKEFRKIIYIELILSPFIALIIANLIDLQYIIDRFLAITTGISERSDQWQFIDTLGYEFLFGNGLGTMSHKALDINEYLINDGGYFKLIAELGLVGFLMFIFILINTAYNLLNRSKKNHLIKISTFIIILFLIHMVIGNTVFYMVLSPIFWITLGFLNRKEKYDENNSTLPTTIS